MDFSSVRMVFAIILLNFDEHRLKLEKYINFVFFYKNIRYILMFIFCYIDFLSLISCVYLKKNDIVFVFFFFYRDYLKVIMSICSNVLKVRIVHQVFFFSLCLNGIIFQ